MLANGGLSKGQSLDYISADASIYCHQQAYDSHSCRVCESPAKSR